MEQNLEKYAQLILQKGINIQANEPLLILGPIEATDFIDRLTFHAKEMGVTDIGYIIIDSKLVKEHLLSLTPEEIYNCPLFDRSKMDEYAKKGGSVIALKGADPDEYEDVPSEKILASQKRMLETEAYARGQRKTYNMPWVIAAVATDGWAKKVFPNEENPTNKLWEAIFTCTLVNEEDPIAAWDKKIALTIERCEKINSLSLKTLHYQNDLGTDLTVTLPENFRFTGAKEYSPSHKRDLVVNLPTEEIFCSPHYLGTNGTVYSTKPLVYQGNIIENFYLTFKDGKVIDYKAEKGQKALESIFEIDEQAKYLGEVALVDYDSPISNSNILFYTTLYDENASCHLALGSGFPTTVKGGGTMTRDELLKAGVNHSDTHVDFMVGSKDLSIIGKDVEGNEYIIFKDGNFALS